MAYTVFDGVAKFTADSSDLDSFIVKLEQGLTTASEKAAESTRVLKAAQDDFRAAIQAVSAEGGNTAENLANLAQAEQNLALAAAAAKTEHANLKASLTEVRTEFTGFNEVLDVQRAEWDGLTPRVAVASAAIKEASLAEQIATDTSKELASTLGGMLGVLALVEAFKSMTEGVQQSVLSLQNLSDRTGISITTLAGLQHEAETVGVEFNSVEQGLTRLSRSQALAVEGGKAQQAAFERLGISMEQVKSSSPEQLFYTVAEAMQQSKSRAEENASAFALFGRGGAALIPILNQNTEELKKNIEEAGKASGVTAEAGIASREWQAQTALLSEAFRSNLIPIMEAVVPVIKGVETAGTALWADLKDIGVGIGGLFVGLFDGIKGLSTLIVDVLDGNMKQLVVDAKNIGSDFSSNWQTTTALWKSDQQSTADFIKKIWTDTQPLKPLSDDLSGLTEKTKSLDIEGQLKAQLDKQIGDINNWKAQMNLAFSEGKISAVDWALAQQQAANAAAVAHEQFYVRLSEAYAKAGNAQKALQAQEMAAAEVSKQDAATIDALAKSHEKWMAALQKSNQELLKFQELQVIKDWEALQKATDALTKSDEELTKAQGKLAETQGTKNFAAQEEAIKDLAKIGLITEEQKAAKLRALYTEEENDAVTALRNTQEKLVLESAKGNSLFGPAQVADLQKNLKAAEGDFTQSIAIIKASFAAVEKAHPFLTPAQITELHTQLNLALAAFTNTQTQITGVEDKYAKERMANQKGEVGNAIAMATAAGNTLLAEDLKQHQSALIAINDMIALAKARGQDTTALKAQQKAIQGQTTALVKQAGAVSTLHQAWDLFSADFKAKIKDNDSAAQEMATTFQTVATGMESAISSAFAAMVSGSETAGQAIEKAVFSMIGKIAEQWGAYYLARAIADTFDNPAAAGAEYAAGIALEALGGLMQGLSSLAGSTSKPATTTTAATQSTSTVASGTSSAQPVGTQNVEHFATGTVALGPTLAVIGDSESGGSQKEAVLPLENQRALGIIADALIPALLYAMSKRQGAADVPSFFDGALVSSPMLAMIGDNAAGGSANEGVLPLDNAVAMTRIAESILGNMPRFQPGAASSLLSPSMLASVGSVIERTLEVRSTAETAGRATSSTDVQAIATAFAKALDGKTPMGGTINIQLESDIPSLVKRINHQVSTGRTRLLASNSIRLTKRS